MATLAQVLGGLNLSGRIQAIKDGIPRRFPDAFYKATRRVNGCTATYTLVRGQRQLARLVQYGAPSKHIANQNISTVPVVLMNSTEDLDIPLGELVNIINPESLGQGEISPNGEAEIARQLNWLSKRYDNIRAASIAQALITGRIKFDSDGNMLPDSIGNPAVTVNFQVPATNQGILSNIISGATTWSTSTNPIGTMIQQLKKQAVQATGYELKHALYGSAVTGYLTQNASFQSFLAFNQTLGAQYLQTGQVPNGLWDMQWQYGGDMFFVDSSGNVQQLLGDNQVIFFPDPEPDWYELVEGSTLIPRDIGTIAQGAVTIPMTNVTGRYAWAQATVNPSAVKFVGGDVWLPLIKVPAAIYQATVQF